MFSELSILLQLNNIDVNETVEGDDRAFEIWHEREDSVRKYTLQARTVIIKNSWLRDLRELQQRYSMPAWSEWNTRTHTFFCVYHPECIIILSHFQTRSLIINPVYRSP